MKNMVAHINLLKDELIYTNTFDDIVATSIINKYDVKTGRLIRSFKRNNDKIAYQYILQDLYYLDFIDEYNYKLALNNLARNKNYGIAWLANYISYANSIDFYNKLSTTFKLPKDNMAFYYMIEPLISDKVVEKYNKEHDIKNSKVNNKESSSKTNTIFTNILFTSNDVRRKYIEDAVVDNILYMLYKSDLLPANVFNYLIDNYKSDSERSTNLYRNMIKSLDEAFIKFYSDNNRPINDHNSIILYSKDMLNSLTDYYKNIINTNESKDEESVDKMWDDFDKSSANKSTYKDKKDENYISWDTYFMGVADLAKFRSKDPSCKVGACIVSKDNKIVSTGYNGFPYGCSDDKFPWSKGDEDETKNKYFYVVHAELNAILNSPVPVKDTILYVTKFPCNECAKAIIQSGIKKIIFKDDNEDLESDSKFIATSKMFKAANIFVEKYNDKNVTILF